MVARVGGIISLLLEGLRTIYVPLPMLIMGTIAALAGVLAIFFPETTGQKLPMTMDEAIDIGKNSRFKFGSCHNNVNSDDDDEEGVYV